MLKNLETYFKIKGWYSGTHKFLSLKLEGGFEAFSGRASETWEYRWVVTVIENKEMEIPAIIIQGKVYESLDDICAKVLTILKSEKIKKEITTDMKPEPEYHNPNTKKSEKLFDTLIPVYDVKYANPVHGWKGESVSIILEADNEQAAIDKAIKNEEFINYIDMKHFDKNYITVHKPIGNYVIGKVNHYKGDIP